MIPYFCLVLALVWALRYAKRAFDVLPAVALVVVFVGSQALAEAALSGWAAIVVGAALRLGAIWGLILLGDWLRQRAMRAVIDAVTERVGRALSSPHALGREVGTQN